MLLIVAACCLFSGFCAGLAVSALAHVVMRDLQNADVADGALKHREARR